MTSSRQGVDENLRFSKFLEPISEFSIFFHEIFMVARSDRILATHINSLLICALVGLETRLKVSILTIFDDFGRFWRCRFWHKPLTYDNDLSLKFCPIYLLLRDIKEFFIAVTIKPKSNTTQTRSSKNLAKCALWSGPYKMPISVLLIRKTWNLVSV